MEKDIFLPCVKPSIIEKWFVKKGRTINQGTVMCSYKVIGSNEVLKLRSPNFGTVTEILTSINKEIEKGMAVLKLRGCAHPIVMKDMCAECGEDLREKFGVAGDRKEQTSASVAMVHSIPELIVSNEQAQELGRADEQRLVSTRKLVLLVDLDETLLHTTNDNVPPNLKDVYHFQLHHGNSMLWYHTKFRPGTKEFLEKMSKLYELHICTFGARLYAHTMASYLDPEKKLFSHRILSRDEAFDPRSKQANLRALFPCGDSMVCIIDDREEVWKFSPNMIKVKPYHFFEHTADINAPPGMERKEKDSDKLKSRIVKVHKIPKKKPPEAEKPIESENDTHQNKEKTESVKKDPKEAESVSNDKMDGIETDDLDKGSGDKTDLNPSADTYDSSKDESDVDKASMDTRSSENVTKSELETDAEKKTADEIDTNRKTSQNQQSEDSAECIEEIVAKNKGVGDSSMDSEKELDISFRSNMSTDVTETGDELKEGEYDEVVEWEDTDDYLLYLEEILTQVHKVFFDMYDQIKQKSNENIKEEDKPNLKKILPYAKQKVLQGIYIVFTGVVPTNMPLERSRPYAVAKSLGAHVQTDVNKKTTHVVAAKKGTVKVIEALKRKDIAVVQTDWLWACDWRWERVDERLFLLDDSSTYKPKELQQDQESLKRKAPSTEGDAPKNDIEQSSSKRPKSELPPSSSVKRKAPDPQLQEDSSSDSTSNSKRMKSGAEKEVVAEDSVPGISYDMSSASNTLLRQRRFSESINPLALLSQEDIDDLSKEVDDMSEEESEEEAEGKKDGDSEGGDEEEDLGSDDHTLRQQVLGLSSPETSSDESMSGDYPQGWRPKSNSPPRDDHSHLLTIDDPHEAKSELLYAAQSSNHFLFEEDSKDSLLGRTDEDSQDSGDDELAAAVERGLFS